MNTSNSVYVDRLSAAQLVKKYNRNDSSAKILNDVVIQVVDLDQSPIKSIKIELVEPCIVEIIAHNNECAKCWKFDSILNNFDNIYGLRFVNCSLSSSVTTSFLTPLLSSKCLAYLTMLDLSYTHLSIELVEVLSKTINVLLSGYCPIKRLLLSRCGLGIKGGLVLLENILSNIYIEELLLNGNDMTDAVITPLLNYINNTSVCKVTVLSIAGNGFTTDGMTRIGYAMRTNQCMEQLSIHDNQAKVSTLPSTVAHRMADGAVDSLMLSISENKLLTTLNISNCNLQSCIWGDHLRILTTLTSLYLNNNCIDDDGCGILCSALCVNCSIRVCDLSYNMFTGELQSNAIGDMLALNQSLNYLHIAGNVLTDDTWASIANGLMKNNTLLVLNCQWCELSVQQGQSLCHCLVVNEHHPGNTICTLVLDHNPLSRGMMEHPREYVNQLHDPQHATELHGTGKNRHFLTLQQTLNTAHASGLAHTDPNSINSIPIAVNIPHSSTVAVTVNAYDARRARRFEILSAHEAIKLVGQLDQELLRKENEEDEMNHEEEEEKEDNRGDPVSMPKSKSTPAPGSRTSHSKGNQPSQHATAGPLATRIEHNTGLSMDHQEHILPGYVKTQAERLHTLAAEASVVNNHRVLTVGYGYSTEVIGVIRVSHGTTYLDAHDMVKPLVSRYLANNNQVLIEELLENYSFLDPTTQDGQSVTLDDAQFRTVWAEAAMVNCVLTIRPANWITLGGDDGDDE